MQHFCFCPHFSWAELKDVHKRPISLKYCSQIWICTSPLLRIHPPHRCGITRCWLDNMIIAQVCLRLATIKGRSKPITPLFHNFHDILIYWGVCVCVCVCIYMKSSFPKRDKRQILKKWVRHAILLCTEPIHCSINVSCQIAIFPCLKCTARCSSFPNRYKRRTCF